jgi:hypothetical protein
MNASHSSSRLRHCPNRQALLFLALTVFAPLTMMVFPVSALNAYEVKQELGVDQRVDYKKLGEIGAWDDRNYTLTLEDVRLLAENEPVDPLPAWYRVKLRRDAGIPAGMPVPYNRSHLNHFLQEYGGFEINGKTYRKTRMQAGKYEVVTEADR